jgi:hypothetical protein
VSAVVEFVRPRVLVVPESSSSAGREAVELAALAGLELDPWEAYVLEHALAERDDGRWSAVEVGVCAPRQNGKNAILEARELAALFLHDERLVIHSAHHFKTSKEHFLRLIGLIEGTPELSRRVHRILRSHGEEGIELKGGQRILFVTRTKSSGRGFTAPLVVFDEAMFLAETSVGALIPTQSAMPNRQRWYAGSAVDQTIHPDGLVFARIRERALRNSDGRLAYFEWSADGERPELVTDGELEDEAVWAAANPGYGIRISREAIEDELRALAPRTFAVERLGIGDWPDSTGNVDTVIPLEAWAELADEESELVDPVCFSFDVAPDRATAAVAAAGRRLDGLFHVEVTHHKRGTGWVVPTLEKLREKWDPLAILCDATGPAGSLLHRALELGFDVETVTAPEHAKACGQLVDLVDEHGLRHLGSAELVAALKGATTRPLGDAWAWSRKNSSVDISPLVASTLALWGSSTLASGGGDDLGVF